MPVFDLEKVSVRDLNQALHGLPEDGGGEIRILNPAGNHNVAVGLVVTADIREGHVGYYCGGMNKRAQVTIAGHAGQGVAENIMSGTVRVTGNASQCAAATGCGGLVVIEGDAGARCGISMKGVDIVVGGSVGHMSAFLAQAGRLVVLGDAGPSLGDSIYEAKIYVAGKVDSLGADCIEKEMTPEHVESLGELLRLAGFDGDPKSFRRFGSARKLYNFHIDHADEY